MAGKPLGLEFVTSAPTLDELPDSVADVAVVGRSNVGKSSLINALANRKQLAAVSGTPGRTRLLNAFRLAEGPEPRPLLVDLPGYGYAKVPKAVKDTWGPMIEGYLTGRGQLAMVLVLLASMVEFEDAAIGVSSNKKVPALFFRVGMQQCYVCHCYL